MMQVSPWIIWGLAISSFVLVITIVVRLVASARERKKKNEFKLKTKEV
jgi:hypothetical protein